MDVLFDHGIPGKGLWSVDASPSEGSVLGAMLFWGYIAAAVYLIWDITRTIRALKKISGMFKYGYSPFYAWVFALQLVLSFASVSWNMLNVLAQSYQGWAKNAGVSAPQRLIGAQSLLGPERTELYLWSWSVQSTLFRDFALEITADPARWTWSQSSLGITCVVAYWMGIEGRKGRPLPKLWTFFALLQILPTSVTLNFFILALLFTPKAPPKQFVLKSPSVWIAAGLGYYFLLVEASTEQMKPYIIPIILAARLLLVVPFVMGIAYVEPTDKILEKVSPLQLFDLPLAFGALTVWSVLHQGYFAASEFGIEGIWNAKSSHPAVSTLAYDGIQSLIAAFAWTMSAHIARPVAHQRPVEETPEGLNRKSKRSKK